VTWEEPLVGRTALVTGAPSDVGTGDHTACMAWLATPCPPHVPCRDLDKEATISYTFLYVMGMKSSIAQAS